VTRHQPADLLLTGGRIWTGAGGGAAPAPTALALRGGRVLAVGTDREIEALRGPGTRVIPLGGRFVCPGFVDAHLHLQSGGLQLSRVDLRGVTDRETFEARVREHARRTPPGGWILGADWDHQDLGGLPTREWLDRAAPGHPVFLNRLDMHMGVASSPALRLAGIGATSSDPEGGLVDREPDTGEPTGILRERAMDAISRIVPPPSWEERRNALLAGLRHALERGVTQLHDMGALHSAEESWLSLKVLRAIHDEGRLPLRVSAAIPFTDRAELDRMVREEGRGDAFLRWGAVKGFVDGSLGSSTAWMHEPYLGQGDNCGVTITDPAELEEGILDAARRGLQPIVHAIGDRAGDWLLGVYEELERRFPGADLRPRFEHAQHLSPEGLVRAGRTRAILSPQPMHLIEDGRWAGGLLGPEREGRSFAFRTLLENGARLAFGSDWTVAPVDPIGALQAAVSRRLRGDGGEPGPAWTPGEAISLDAALRAHTFEGARAAFLEGETGVLAAGMRGDVVVLSRDPFAVAAVAPERLSAEVAVEMTLVEGEVAWAAEGCLDDG